MTSSAQEHGQLAASGLFPFNPERVLRTVPKPAELNIPATNEVSCQQDAVPQTQKFSKAAHLSFSKGALQQNHIHLLMAINNEAKTRRSTKSDILLKGTGKVISYEDLEAARAKRAEKDAAKAANKGKRGRPRKGTAPEVEATEAAATAPQVEATALEVEATPSIPKGKEKRSRKRKSTALEAEAGSSVPKSKVARMSEVKAAIDTECHGWPR